MVNALILNYGRVLPRDDKGFSQLQYQHQDGNKDIRKTAAALKLWSTATFMSQHDFQSPDIICDPSLPQVLSVTFDSIFTMPPSNPALYITPAFWVNMSDWLNSDGIFVAIPADDHLIDPYLTKYNKYDLLFKHQQFRYAQMTPDEKSMIDFCYSCLRTDISKLTNQQLIPITDDTLIQNHLTSANTGSYKALFFKKI